MAKRLAVSPPLTGDPLSTITAADESLLDLLWLVGGADHDRMRIRTRRADQQTNAPAAKPQVEPAAAPSRRPLRLRFLPRLQQTPRQLWRLLLRIRLRGDIFRSAGAGDIDTVKYHLANGIKLNARDKTGKTALLWACNKKHEVVYHLLDRGANPNVADNNKLTPLFWAVRMRRPELVTALLNKGADITVRDSRGKDVFDYAKDDVVLEILRSHEKK